MPKHVGWVRGKSLKSLRLFRDPPGIPKEADPFRVPDKQDSPSQTPPNNSTIKSGLIESLREQGVLRAVVVRRGRGGAFSYTRVKVGQK